MRSVWPGQVTQPLWWARLPHCEVGIPADAFWCALRIKSKQLLWALEKRIPVSGNSSSIHPWGANSAGMAFLKLSIKKKIFVSKLHLFEVYIVKSSPQGFIPPNTCYSWAESVWNQLAGTPSRAPMWKAGIQGAFQSQAVQYRMWTYQAASLNACLETALQVGTLSIQSYLYRREEGTGFITASFSMSFLHQSDLFYTEKNKPLPINCVDALRLLLFPKLGGYIWDALI